LPRALAYFRSDKTQNSGYKRGEEGSFGDGNKEELYMLLIGQWILFGIVVLLGITLLWYAASYIFRLALVLLVAALIVYGLHRFSLLPEPVQKYIDELFSQDLAQKAKVWIHQKSDGEKEEKTTEDDTNVRS
jgi:hypothetical protein